MLGRSPLRSHRKPSLLLFSQSAAGSAQVGNGRAAKQGKRSQQLSSRSVLTVPLQGSLIFLLSTGRRYWREAARPSTLLADAGLPGLPLELLRRRQAQHLGRETPARTSRLLLLLRTQGPSTPITRAVAPNRTRLESLGAHMATASFPSVPPTSRASWEAEPLVLGREGWGRGGAREGALCALTAQGPGWSRLFVPLCARKEATGGAACTRGKHFQTRRPWGPGRMQTDARDGSPVCIQKGGAGAVKLASEAAGVASGRG